MQSKFLQGRKTIWQQQCRICSLKHSSANTRIHTVHLWAVCYWTCSDESPPACVSIPPSALLEMPPSPWSPGVASGWPLSLGSHLESQGGIAAEIQDHSSNWKRKPWGESHGQIFVPMNKLPWISYLAHHSDYLGPLFGIRYRFYLLRQNQKKSIWMDF